MYFDVSQKIHGFINSLKDCCKIGLQQSWKELLNSVLAFLFLGFGFGGGHVSNRHVVDDAAVIEVVGFFGFKISEQLEEVSGTADTEPESGHDTDNTDDEETLDEEVVTPHLFFPGGDGVPDDRNDEEDQEVLDKAEEEHRPGKNSVTLGIVVVDTQQFLVEESSEAERFFGGIGFVVSVTVSTAMEHSVHVERRFAGEQRD